MKEKQRTFREVRRNPDDYLAFIRRERHPVSFLLDRIGDVRNLGALFRIADAARIRKIYGLGMDAVFSSRKLDRVARSTQQYVPYQSLGGLTEVEALKKESQLIVLEITDRSIPYCRFESSYPCILVIGNEKEGVSEELIALADFSIHIPMHGWNHSMNAAVAAGIVTFSFLERWKICAGDQRLPV